MSRPVLSLGVVSAALAAAAVAQAPSFERVATETVVVAKIGNYKQGTITVSADGRRFADGKEQSWGSRSRWTAGLRASTTRSDPSPGDSPTSGSPERVREWGLDEFPGIKPMISRRRPAPRLWREGEGLVADRLRPSEGKPFKSVGGPVLTHDGQHLAYAAKVEDGWCVVRDGAEGKTYEQVGPPVSARTVRTSPTLPGRAHGS